MAQTLEELKAQNAAQEAAQTVETPKVEDELETERSETEEQTQQENEGDGQENPDEEIEAWQAEETDDPASKDSGKKYSDSDMAGLRKKLQHKLSEKDDELERLKAEVEALKQGTQRPAQDAGKVPTLEAFDYDEGKYAAAMQAWVMSQVTNVTKATETQAKHAQQTETLNKQVESHYERAANLVKERTIDPELYHSADASFRKTIETVFPGQGDVIANQLIAHLGEGSEKVTFFLGRNTTEQALFKAKLMEDRNGLAASMYLGRLLAKISMPVKKTTNAPAPAARAEGGDSSGADSANLKRKYEKTEDVQERIDIKRAAKRAGIDVKNW